MAYRVAKNTNPYNPYSDIQSIYDKKNNWKSAYEKNDKTAMENEAKQAQKYYASLRSNGYSGVADDLAAADEKQAKSIMDYYAIQGKTATRPYLYGKAEAYGLKPADVDKLTKWDDASGQVYFGGTLIGTPDAISSNGISFWNGTDALDKAFDAEAKNRGWARTPDNQYGVSMQQASDISKQSADTVDAYAQEGLNMLRNLGKNRQAQFDYANQDIGKTDEFNTMWGKIMPEYGYAADTAALNAAADSAASNGGNIDSFAAANARRQREAALAKGQELAARMGLAAYESRAGAMDAANNGMREDVDVAANSAGKHAAAYDIAAARAQSVANDMFSNEQSKQQNVAQNEYTMAQAQKLYGEMLGTNTEYAMRKLNPYFGEDGSVDTTKDYMQAIEDNTALLDAELAKPEDEQDKELIGRYKQNIAFAEQARKAKTKLEDYKEFANDGYVEKEYKASRYSPDVNLEKQLESSETIAANNNAASLEKTKLDNEASLEETKLDNEASLEETRLNNEASLEKTRLDNQNNIDVIGASTSAGTISSDSANDSKNSSKNDDDGVNEITSITKAEHDQLVSDLNKMRINNWGYKTGMFDVNDKGQYVLNTNKATVESVMEALRKKGYAESLTNVLLREWGVSDKDIQTGWENYKKKYVNTAIGS